MYKIMLEKVVPRLLRPLEEDGRTVVPRLCHGDLWDGNVSVDVNTGRPIIFDAIPLYAHNECEFLLFPPVVDLADVYTQSNSAR